MATQSLFNGRAIHPEVKDKPRLNRASSAKVHPEDKDNPPENRTSNAQVRRSRTIRVKTAPRMPKSPAKLAHSFIRS